MENKEFVSHEQMIANLLKFKSDLIHHLNKHNLNLHAKDTLDRVNECLSGKYTGLK